MSKGSAPRPFSVALDEYATRYDNIFKPKEKPHATTPDPEPKAVPAAQDILSPDPRAP